MMRIGAWGTWFGLLSLAVWGPVQAQPRVFTAGDFADEILEFNRPRIALAADGAFAIAFEALIQSDATGFTSWKIVVQRFAASGTTVGPLHVFEGESCGGFDIWLSDLVENAELAFRPDGILLVLMQHSGEFQLGGDGVRSAEATLGAVDTDGQVIDLNGSGACVQQKLIFPGGDRQDRPRMALTPAAAVLITLDGFFDGSTLRNVAIRALDGQLNEVIEQIIPHDDPGSQQAFHMFPDIATNGSLILSTWQQCPVVDNQGNANECDVGAQFASITNQGLVGVGGNRTVTTGDPVGTVSLWPSAAMNAAGNSVVAWADTRTGQQGDIFSQRFDAGGQPVGGNVQVSEGTGLIWNRPEVAMLNDGRFMAVWTDSSSAGFRARGRRFRADGSPEGPSFVLLEQTGLETGLPAVASNGADFVYTWLGERNGSPALYSSNLGVVVSKEEETREEVPQEPLRLQSYPNPFNEATTLTYELPAAGPVTLAVYDVLGREVARLVEGLRPAGSHRAPLEGSGLAPGLYLVRLQHAGQLRTHLLVRAD